MRCTLFLSFFICVITIDAQESFVKFFENDESRINIYDIIYDEDNESYFILGNKIDTLNGLWIAKLNKSGELVNERYFYGDTLYNFQLGRRNTLMKVR